MAKQINIEKILFEMDPEKLLFKIDLGKALIKDSLNLLSNIDLIKKSDELSFKQIKERYNFEESFNVTDNKLVKITIINKNEI